MPRNGAGIFSLDARYLVSEGDTILPSQHNPVLEDLQTDANTPRPIVAGGTGASTATTARTNLSVYSIADVDDGFTPKVATRTALKALDTATTKAVVLTEASRQKLFMWMTGDFTDSVAGDTSELAYIPADGIDPALGCWVAVTGAGASIVPVIQGGTGANDAATALGNLGGMASATYDPNAVAGDAFDMANMVEATDAKIMTAAERTKLAGIEAGADVTDATNVDAAGATMNTDTDVSANSWVLDEDDMASDSATKVPTQQSVKAYVGALGLPAITADTFLRANADATGYDALSTAEAWAALANESAFAQPKSIPPKFWPNVHPGAKIHRMNDRVLIGAATDNSGETPATSSEDWLETLRTSTTKNSQLAVLSTIGQTAIIGGSRTSDFSQAGSQGCIAGSFWALNDNAVDVQSAYAAYMEAHREAGAGTTHGFELDTVNFGDLVTIHPYLMFSTGLTSGAWLAAGGGTAWPGAGDCSAAVAILANSDSARWEKGIVFHAAGLVGTDGDGTGSAVAIEMARGHAVRWLFTGGSQGASISSNVSNTAATQQIQFSDLGTLFRNAAGKNMFQIGIGSSVVNGVKVTPANTGVGPVVGAIGDDANIDLGLAPKGTGLVRLTGQDSVLATTASAFSATRYVKIKDDAGNVLYVPCTGSAW